LFHRPRAAYLRADFDELTDELLEMSKLGNLALGLFLSGGSRKRLGNGLALNFAGQPRIRPVHRLTALMTVTVGLPAATAGIRHGPAAQIAETGELFHEFGSTSFEIL